MLAARAQKVRLIDSFSRAAHLLATKIQVNVMARIPRPPNLDGLKRQIAKYRYSSAVDHDGGLFVRETYCMSREDARRKAREWFDTFPKAAYWTEVESWRQTASGDIEFTMRRLPSAD